MHLISLFFIQELTEWEIHFPTGGFCHRRCVKELSLVLSFDPPGGKKVRKERRRTAVAPFDDFSPYETASNCRCLCSFFPSGKKEPKKVLPSCAAQHSPAGFLQIPLCYLLKCGVSVQDARATLKISRSRRGRSIVHQIYGSKAVAVA